MISEERQTDLQLDCKSIAALLFLSIPIACAGAEPADNAVEAAACAAEEAGCAAEAASCAAEYAIATANEPVESDLDIPRYPDWPPEIPSSRISLDNLISDREGLSLYDAGEKFVTAFSDAGYLQNSFYSVPGGFILVTDTEKIDLDGSALEGNARYQMPGSIRDLSLGRIIRNLFFERPTTMYRYIAVVVSNQPFVTSEKQLKIDEAKTVVQHGITNLTDRAKNVPFSKDFKVTALIYEYENRGVNYDLDFVAPGRINPAIHLKKTNLGFTVPNQFGK